jgi:hypothetical protein
MKVAKAVSRQPRCSLKQTKKSRDREIKGIEVFLPLAVVYS